MELSQLGLNRFGFKSSQTSETIDSVEKSLNTSNINTPYQKFDGDASNVQTGTVLRNVIIEAQIVTVIPGFTNAQMTSIPLPANGIRIDYSGIFGRKAGVTTFSLDAAGNAIFSGDITGGTIIGALIQTSSGGDRIEINSANEILFYQGGDLRTAIANGILSFYGLGGIGAGAIYGSGTNQLMVDVSGSGDYEFTESEFYSLNGSNLGRDTAKWHIVYADQVGDASNKVTLHGAVVACPLPTIAEALSIIRKIPEPTYVGERGHFGDGLYFDDLTFPEEVLHDVDGKKEIEHTHMIGLLMKAVVELTKKVDDLEKRLL